MAPLIDLREEGLRVDFFDTGFGCGVCLESYETLRTICFHLWHRHRLNIDVINYLKYLIQRHGLDARHINHDTPTLTEQNPRNPLRLREANDVDWFRPNVTRVPFFDLLHANRNNNPEPEEVTFGNTDEQRELINRLHENLEIYRLGKVTDEFKKYIENF